MARILFVNVLFLAVASSGCSLNRSAIGCLQGYAPDDTHRCVALPDADVDAFVPMMDGGMDDAGPDARVDAFIPDAYMPDAPMDDGGFDAGTDSGLDGGPPDSGTDACVAVAETCNYLDDNCDGRIDEGTACDFRITYTAAVGDTTFFVRIAWNGPGGPEMADYYVRGRRSGAVVSAGTSAPELATGRIIRTFPVSDPGGLGAACTAATCPSLCSRTTCPGFPPDGTYSYAFAYTTLPILEGEVVLNPDPGSGSDGPMPGDSAWLEMRLP